MSVLQFKKYELVPIIKTKGVIDDMGDFVEGTTTFDEPLQCDAVPNGGGETIKIDDGVAKLYTFECSLFADCRDFTMGERVLLRREGKEYELSVLGFMRYQRSAKLWIG